MLIKEQEKLLMLAAFNSKDIKYPKSSVINERRMKLSQEAFREASASAYSGMDLVTKAFENREKLADNSQLPIIKQRFVNQFCLLNH